MMLENQAALVTGGGKGIGRSIALALAHEGADVVVNDIDREAAENTSEEIKALGRESMVILADISQSSEVEEMVKTVLQRFKRIDILINNAGITRDGLLLRMKENDWDAVMSINLKSVYLCTKAVMRTMMKQRSGRIINLASVVGVMGNAGQSNYAASKAGVIGFTKSTAKELAPRGITVNAVAPGFIATEMTEKLSDEVKQEFLNKIPLNKAGTPEDVAHVVRFLASPDSHYITGQVLHIDGGMVM